MIWIVVIALTALAVLSVLWPLASRGGAIRRTDANREFYEAQRAEIARDRARGLLGPEEAASAETEAARRLIAAETGEEEAGDSTAARRIAALTALVLAPALAFGLYLHLGSPAYPDRPLEARLNAPPGQIETVAAVAKIERHLANNPGDGRGWELVAPVYIRLGRAPDAVNAWRKAIELLGPTPARYGGLGEALVFVSEGAVSPEAMEAFEQALKLDEAHPQALFFKGLAAEQGGDAGTAREIWSDLAKRAPEGSAWAQLLRQRLDRLDGPDAGAAGSGAGAPAGEAGRAIAALPAGERAEAVRSMVEGLADRLRRDGGDVDEWIRLIRSYRVLQEPRKAQEAAQAARAALAGDEARLRRLQEQMQALDRTFGEEPRDP